MRQASGPLAAYRVLDLTDARGILCGKILGDLGADVVRVEPPAGNPARREGPFAGEAPDPERSLYWWASAENCRSLVADLGTLEGAARVRDLARRADFLIESFFPGFLDRLGFGWEALAALDHRRRTREGQHVDLSQFEASLHFLAPAILDYTGNGRVATRRGNADDRAAPHNAYPCAGTDQWCVIACEDEAEWRALCGAMGKPQWCGRSDFATPESRRRNAGELDRLIGRWTIAQEARARALARRLKPLGIPAGVVQSCADLHRDPQLAVRAAFQWLEHPEIGRAPYEAWPFRFSRTSGRLRRAPCLGEHTHEVLGELLAMSGEQVDRLITEGVLR